MLEIIVLFYLVYPIILLAKLGGGIKVSWWIVLRPLWLPPVLVLASIAKLTFILILLELA